MKDDLYFVELLTTYTKDFYALKPRLNFLSTLPPAFHKDNFLPIKFMVPQLDDCFMQLLMAEFLEN